MSPVLCIVAVVLLAAPLSLQAQVMPRPPGPSPAVPPGSIEDEGDVLPTRTRLNFTGRGITCADDEAGDEIACAVNATALYRDASDADPTLQHSFGTILLDADANGSAEATFAGDGATVLKGFYFNPNAAGAVELMVEHPDSGGGDVRVARCLQIGSSAGTAQAQVCKSGAGAADPFYFDADGDATRDEDEPLLTPRISTSAPVDGSDACSTGDRWLKTSATRAAYWCVDGASDEWHGVALADEP